MVITKLANLTNIILLFVVKNLIGLTVLELEFFKKKIDFTHFEYLWFPTQRFDWAHI